MLVSLQFKERFPCFCSKQSSYHLRLADPTSLRDFISYLPNLSPFNEVNASVYHWNLASSFVFGTDCTWDDRKNCSSNSHCKPIRHQGNQTKAPLFAQIRTGRRFGHSYQRYQLSSLQILPGLLASQSNSTSNQLKFHTCLIWSGNYWNWHYLVSLLPIGIQALNQQKKCRKRRN